MSDFLDDEKLELEAKFRELEYEEEIRKMKSRSGSTNRASDSKRNTSKTNADDPLAAMKDKLNSTDDAQKTKDDSKLFVLVLCTSCHAKNRVDLDRLRNAAPVCGSCKKALAFAKSN